VSERLVLRVDNQRIFRRGFLIALTTRISTSEIARTNYSSLRLLLLDLQSNDLSACITARRQKIKMLPICDVFTGLHLFLPRLAATDAVPALGILLGDNEASEEESVERAVESSSRCPTSGLPKPERKQTQGASPSSSLYRISHLLRPSDWAQGSSDQPADR
jgi:hypothetical protein